MMHVTMQTSRFCALTAAAALAGCWGADADPGSAVSPAAQTAQGPGAQARPASTHNASSSAPQVTSRSNPSVLQALQHDGAVRVIVNLRGAPSTSAWGEQHVLDLARLQDNVIGQVQGRAFETLRRYSHAPALAGVVSNHEALEKLGAHADVESIQLDARTQGHLSEAVPAIGADVAKGQYGLDGTGITVAVLDSGVDTDHPDLSDDIAAQHCFTQGVCRPNNTTEGTNAEDEHGHGTNVAGIITSKGTVAVPGFAPKAKIVAVRVLDASNKGWMSDWLAGLNWVLANLSIQPVQLVNASLGTSDLYSSNCDGDWPALANVLTQLDAKGVAVFASSGNAGSSSQLPSPACNSHVISVGATYDSNMGRMPNSGTFNAIDSAIASCFDSATNLSTVTCFTNSNSSLDILAPGAITCASGKGGGISCFVGTSQASPAAAAVAALMLQCKPSMTPAQIESTLKSTGVKSLTGSD